jgi:C-terminal processing protease CtpA/Prc
VHSLDVGLSTASKGSTADPSYDGVIGGEVLRRFKIIFNYPRKQIILEPSSALDQPFDIDTSGISLVATGENLNTIVVEHVLEDSPASSAGLKEGDTIVSLDGRGTSDYTLDQVRQMFKGDDSEHQLEIRRGDERLQVRIRSGELI